MELKVCVTNYANSFGRRTSPRPITNQISDVLRDAEKLGRLAREACERHIFLLAYPMPLNYASHVEWGRHLERLRSRGTSVMQTLASRVEQSGQTATVVGYTLHVL